MSGNIVSVCRFLLGVKPVGRFNLGERVKRLHDKVPRGVGCRPALVTAQHPLRLTGQRRAVDWLTCHARALRQNPLDITPSAVLVTLLDAGLHHRGRDAECNFRRLRPTEVRLKAHNREDGAPKSEHECQVCLAPQNDNSGFMLRSSCTFRMYVASVTPFYGIGRIGEQRQHSQNRR